MKKDNTMKEYRKIKAIISGGGTGGHIFPAISIANMLKDSIRKTRYCLSERREEWRWRRFRLPDMR